jgi:hypothetical protein
MPTIRTAAFPSCARRGEADNLLGELKARPRTTYLGAVRNPHPDLAETQKKETA